MICAHRTNSQGTVVVAAAEAGAEGAGASLAVASMAGAAFAAEVVEVVGLGVAAAANGVVVSGDGTRVDEMSLMDVLFNAAAAAATSYATFIASSSRLLLVVDVEEVCTDQEQVDCVSNERGCPLATPATQDMDPSKRPQHLRVGEKPLTSKRKSCNPFSG